MARPKESLFRRSRAGPSSGSPTLATFARKSGSFPGSIIVKPRFRIAR
jgi:hypothetical protein